MRFIARLFMAAALGAVALAALIAVGPASADTEEPRFTVVERVGDIEIRQYGNRLAADVVVTGDEEDARNKGFRLLADYIFGNNTKKTGIAMTAPVATQSAGSESIAMTAPVATARGPGNTWRVRFFMPSSYTLDTLPKPNNAAVQIVEVPGDTMAVLRFSNSRSAERIVEKTNELVRGLEKTRWVAAGEPVTWLYDPPWTLPFFRRNEVAIPVRQR
jgi:hypothetical protein